MPDQIDEISTVIEKKELSVAEIMMSRAHLQFRATLRSGPRETTYCSGSG